jgi:ankyrin repeat protein
MHAKLKFNSSPVNLELQFFMAISQGKSEELSYLLESGVPISTKAINGGKQGIHIACEFQQIEILEKLLMNGADVNAKTDRGFTPLHVSAQVGNKASILLLLKWGALVNSPIHGEGTTIPLQEAAFHGHVEAINILLAAGGDPEYREKKLNLTAAELAAVAGHDDCVMALLGYRQAFRERVKNILIKWGDIFSDNTPEKNYYLQIKNISESIQGDNYFNELTTQLAQGYLSVKEEVKKLRISIIAVMKQYNADKVLESEVQQILKQNKSHPLEVTLSM